MSIIDNEKKNLKKKKKKRLCSPNNRGIHNMKNKSGQVHTNQNINI